MQKTVSEKTVRAERTPRPTRSERQNALQAAQMGVPEFVVKLMGWQRLKTIAWDTAPHARHD